MWAPSPGTEQEGARGLRSGVADPEAVLAREQAAAHDARYEARKAAKKKRRRGY